MNDKTSSTEPAEEHDGEEVQLNSSRPALELLANLRNGNLMDMLGEEINRVVRGVADCSDAKVGTVTLTLKIGRVKRAANAMQILSIVAGKAPEDPPDYDLLFHDDDGNLFTRDPNQPDMFRGPRST